MKKFAKNPWVIGTGTTVIGGVLLSFVLDWIKGVNLLSTLKSVIKFVVKAIVAFLNFDLKLWWVLIAIALIVVVFIIIAKILEAKDKSNPVSFLHYTKDTVLGYSWEWDYRKTHDGKFTISGLHPVCSKCGMCLKQGGSFGMQMQCLRCNTSQDWKDDYLEDAQMLIEDNIRTKYLQNQ